MFEYDLYFGIPLSPALREQIQQNPQKNVYVYPAESGLEEVAINGVSYLGKRCGNLIDVSGLELLKNNIQSILKKLTQKEAFIEEPLYLLTIEQKPS